MFGLLCVAALVSARAASAPPCAGGLVYSDCHSVCPLVCGAAAPTVCSQVCLAGCACAPEKWRRDKGSEDCLEEADCAADADDALKASAQLCLSTFSWCAASASCIRPWDTPCASDAAAAAATQEPVSLASIGGPKDGEPCLTSAGYSWCGATDSCVRAWDTPCPPSPAPTTRPTQEPTKQKSAGISWSIANDVVLVLAAFVCCGLVAVAFGLHVWRSRIRQRAAAGEADTAKPAPAVETKLHDKAPLSPASSVV